MRRLAQIITFQRPRVDPTEGPDWKDAREAIDEHREPTVDELISNVEAADDRLSESIKEIRAAIANKYDCECRLVEAVTARVKNVLMKPQRVSGEQIMDAIDAHDEVQP